MDPTQHGDLMKKIADVVETTPLQPSIINPDSKFVVATYWWGRGNINKNLQRPCPEDIIDMNKVKGDIKKLLDEENPSFAKLREDTIALDEKSDRTPEETETLKEYGKQIRARVDQFLKTQQGKEFVSKAIRDAMDKLQKEGKFKVGNTYDKMIEQWIADCNKHKCNYVSAEYTFFQQPGMYQYGINAKPLFIKKALESCEGRGVLYIDGDMRPNTYPAVFDMKNVDYMARGWNMDPRASDEYENGICFDPYIMETSGGTMFFSNTPWAHKVLDVWIEASSKFESKGKADDRIISLMFMERDFMRQINFIQLPIEYLWLTDFYNFHNRKDASADKTEIEHPACLTGEDRAAEQSGESITNSREPEGYHEKIHGSMKCDTKCGVFYEYIFFPRREMIAGFEPYLKYLECLKFKDTNERVFEDIVRFDDKYGAFNTIAYQNDTKARALGVSGTGVVSLPQTATIPEILAHLYNRQDVKVGDPQTIPENCDLFATITTQLGPGERYFKTIEIDPTKPMFFSASNVIVQHLLRMCETTQDINKHVSGSYMFFSRIRWGIETPFVPAPVELEEREPPVVASISTPPSVVPTPEPVPASVPPSLPTPEPVSASVPTPEVVALPADVSTILTPLEPLPERTLETVPAERIPDIPDIPDTAPELDPKISFKPTPARNSRMPDLDRSVLMQRGIIGRGKRRTYRKRIVKHKKTKARRAH